MKIAAVFPQTEFGNDPLAIKDYAQSVEAMGFSHIVAYDHVLGANPERPGGWQGPYTYKHPFHEPLVLFSFMSATTTRLGFLTGILILPQRQTALVAKQAAEVDILSSGRLRLGIGVGWNEVEYLALNENFHNRGVRTEEQIEVLRNLWTQKLVSYVGHWHNLPDVGINPLPKQQPIPIWFGGHADAVLKRAARLGNGWLPNYRKAADARPALEKLNFYLAEQGRSREDFGLEVRLNYNEGDANLWQARAIAWKEAGAEALAVNTMNCGFSTPRAHIQALKTFTDEIGVEL